MILNILKYDFLQDFKDILVKNMPLLNKKREIHNMK